MKCKSDFKTCLNEVKKEEWHVLYVVLRQMYRCPIIKYKEAVVYVPVHVQNMSD